MQKKRSKDNSPRTGNIWRKSPNPPEIALILTAVMVIIMLAACRAPVKPANKDINEDSLSAAVFAPRQDAGAAESVCRLGDEKKDWIPAQCVLVRQDTETCVDGVASLNLIVPEAFPGGTIASCDVSRDGPALDLSRYENIALWMKSTGQNENSVLQLVLVEEGAAGEAAEMMPLSLPSAAASGWREVNLPLSGHKERYDAVSTLALMAAEDPGPLELWLDVIEARAAAGSPELKTLAGGAVMTAAGAVLNVPEKT
jgi:hypothetical protein